jgi:alpha-amylase
LNAVAATHRAGMQIYADVIFNHLMGADFTEKVK